MALLVAALVLAGCSQSRESAAVGAVRDNVLEEWQYSDAETVEQMRTVCRSLATQSIAELLDAFAGQWSGAMVRRENQHDYGVLIRYAIEGECPRFRALVEARDYQGHPGWEGVRYGSRAR